ncbi:HtaA domain-containing protein [Patulibacter sp. SYSU D01012]|uniref:HtaA domain-containing protein n=1 Tax=Patulibacter sp. SYSU D01012 TaxID=2817381 RepID=UPI001B302315|nr:HtaA domain-containing protein [Patulibacter sp. SYSU D01012]
MSPSRRLRGPAGAVALATVLAAGAPAVAGAATTSATTKSASTITLGKAFRKDLRSARVTLKAVKPAKLKGSKLTLPVTKTTTSGTLKLTHSGALTLKKGKRSVKLSAWQTVAGKSVRVSAKVGKKRRTIFTITGGKIVKEPLGRVVAVRGGTIKLTRAAAKDLRTTLKAKGLRAGTVGAVELSSSPKPSSTPAPMPTPAKPVLPTAPATPAPTPTTPTQPTAEQCPATLPAREAVENQIGEATWTLRESWYGYLTGLKGCVVGTRGAETTAQTQATPRIAVVGTSASDDGTITIRTRGTVRFLQPAHLIDISIADPTFTIRANGAGSVVADGTYGTRSAAMGGATDTKTFERTELFTFDGATATQTSTRTAWRGIALRFTAAGRDVISTYKVNDDFGTFAIDTQRVDVPSAVEAPVWHVKDSFVTYLGMFGGGVYPEDGATSTSTAGEFAYAPVSTTVDDRGTITTRYHGTLRFRNAHLDNTVKDPVFLTDAARQETRVYADGSYTDAAGGGQVTYTGAHLLTLKLAATQPTVDQGLLRYASVQVVVGADGNAPLGGRYAPGTDFGTMALTLPTMGE